MSTLGADTAREGSRVKQDRALYKGAGEAEDKGKFIKSRRMEPSRALEPAKKKLTSIEAQRIMNVFVDTINRAKLVSMIPYITENLAEFEPIFEEDLFKLFKDHIIIQNCYVEIKQEMIRRHEKKNRKYSEETVVETPQGDDGESTYEPGLREGETEEEEEVSIDGVGATQQPPSPPKSVYDSYKDELASLFNGKDDEKKQEQEEVETSQVGEGQEDDKRDEEPQSEEEQENEENEEEEEEDEECIAANQLLMKNLSIVAEQLSNSCKNVLRAFFKYPSTITIVLEKLDHISPSAAKFIQNLEEMKVIIRNRLLTSPLEEKDQAQYLKEMIQKTQQNEQQIQKLEAELAEAMAIKEEETRKKNDIIRRLQEEIRSIDKQSEDNIRRVRSEAEKHIAAEMKTSDNKCAKIQQELILSRNSLLNLTNDHRNQELDLRRRNYKAETEVENWIQKYDQDMGQLQDEFETIDAIYSEEKKQLSELEERFATLQKEYLIVIDEREVARKAREESERKLVLMVRGATTIQAFWRSYKVRKVLKAKKKKQGSSEKKGKKKK